MRGPERVIVPERLLALLDEHHALTVVRGPLGFGKSTLARLWAETRSVVDDDVVMVSLDEHGSVWSQLVTALDPVLPPRTPGVDHVRAYLLRRARPTTLVIDRLELHLDVRTADALRDLLAAVPHLGLVACVHDDVVLPASRPRTDPVARLLGRDGRLVGAAELAMTPGEVRDLLAASGVHRTVEQAAELHRAVGGWPMLVRRTATALVAGSGEVLDDGVVDRVALDFVLSELLPTMSESSATALCTIALSRRTTVATTVAALGVTARVSDASLRRLVDWGVLAVEVVDGETVHTWPPALHDALRDVLRSQDDGLVREVDRRLARWHLDREEWTPAFQHAHAAGDPELLGAVLDRAWLPLIVYDIDVLAEYFREAPLTWFEGRAFLHGVRDLALRLPRDPADDVMRLPTDSAEAIRKAGSPDVRAELNLGLVQLFGLRRAGRFAEALELAEGLQAIALAARAVSPVDVTDLLAPIFLLTGILHELAGDPASAVTPLGWGVHTGSQSVLRGSARHCASHLAMDHALLGETDQAVQSLEVAAGTPDVGGWVRPRVDVAVEVAAVLVAVSRLDHAGARTAIRRMHAASDPFDEMWPFALYARAQYALLWGDRVAVVQQVLTERASRPGWSASGTPLDTLVRSAEVDLLLALGHRERAVETMRSATGGHSLAAAPRARLALISGRPDRALAIARESLLGHPSPVRVREDLALIEVVARHRTGHTARARDDLDRILAEGTTSLRAFALTPGDDLRTIGAGLPGAAPVFEALDAADIRAVFPASLEPVRLTRREQVILQHLAVGLGRDQIAERLSVSAHTVKSQTHSIYKKLGVRSRAEALVAAQERGVLRGAPKDEKSG